MQSEPSHDSTLGNAAILGMCQPQHAIQQMHLKQQQQQQQRRHADIKPSGAVAHAASHSERLLLSVPVRSLGRLASKISHRPWVCCWEVRSTRLLLLLLWKPAPDIARCAAGSAACC